MRVRPFNHTGPGQPPDFVAPSFARQIAEIARGRSAPRIAVGNLDSVRDFLDVDDVVDAYLRLLDPRRPCGAYNVASGVGRRIGELLDTLIELAGARCEVEVDPERVRPTDHAVGDASRLRAATGWEPRVPWQRDAAPAARGLRRMSSADPGVPLASRSRRVAARRAAPRAQPRAINARPRSSSRPETTSQPPLAHVATRAPSRSGSSSRR